jgi:2-amino-4-hydroxy-6-hydroxymethyldihydropteridine diphosphokinase
VKVAHAFVSVGSNVNPAVNVRRAIRRLALHVHIVAVSTVYCTEPEGRPEQPHFYNCVVQIETGAPPVDLKYQVLRRIEAELGRKRSQDKYAPRTIDLDLILYDDLVIETGDLRLPDPQILRRPFLAIPLCELAPGLTLPGLNVRIDQVAAVLPEAGMMPLEDYTHLLKKELGHGLEK